MMVQHRLPDPAGQPCPAWLRSRPRDRGQRKLVSSSRPGRGASSSMARRARIRAGFHVDRPQDEVRSRLRPAGCRQECRWIDRQRLQTIADVGGTILQVIGWQPDVRADECHRQLCHQLLNCIDRIPELGLAEVARAASVVASSGRLHWPAWRITGCDPQTPTSAAFGSSHRQGTRTLGRRYSGCRLAGV